MDDCLLVAEIGINHNGDLNTATQLIDAADVAGCGFVKFQKRTVDLVYTPEELDKDRNSPWGTTNRQQKEGLEFGPVEYDAIELHTQKKKINWFASPWDVESVRFLAAYDPSYIKIPSALLTSMDLLEEVKSTSTPVIVSTGMSNEVEVKKAIDLLGYQVTHILACTSTYPTAPEEMNMNFITTLKKEFPAYSIGFSNHSPGILYMAIARALGAEMIEFHVTLDRSMYGSDQASSIEPEGMKRIVKYTQGVTQAMGDGKWTVFPSEEIIKQKLRGV